MGLSNYTTGSGGNPPAGGSTPPPAMPPMSGMAGQMNSVTDMLINYNERFKAAAPTLFREEIITQAISVLIGKNKPNALLVGQAGVGKTKIAEDIARLIANDDPLIPRNLKDHIIYELPLSSLVAGAGIVGELETRVTALIDFVCDPKNKAILFIDEIHQLMSETSSTYEKIAQILKPALARGDMHVIGATTLQESRSFDDDPAFSRRFSRLIVDELNREQTLKILTLARPALSLHYKSQVTVTDEVLAAVTVVADEYAKAGHHRPDNAITLLDRAMADTVLNYNKQLADATAAGDSNMVAILQGMTTIPLTEHRVREVAIRLMTGHARKDGLNLPKLTAELSRIKGQDTITAQLAEALRRDDLGVFPRTKPLAWMFAGVSGVGKTEVAKIIAQELTQQPPIILNMTEYHTSASINRIIGSPAGYVGSTSDAELPFDCLESNPYRVVLLDELEKGDKSVQRLFMSALDEGYIRTSRGKVVDFSKAIVIATTNAAKEVTTKKVVGFGNQTAPTTGSLVKALGEHFDAEFLGRFTQIVGFNPLTAAVYSDILQSTYVRERELILENQPRRASALPAAIPNDELDEMVRDTYLEAQGARPAGRAARRFIEDTLLAAMLQPATASSTAASGNADADDEEGNSGDGAELTQGKELSDSHS
ncbi:AAA family ATPase [Arthrobacter koreensis]|uniref:AAA family ATPase n=1 Tax=Arthrobacter koreensis TaxID=199136 RepID=UPI0037FAC02C